MPKQKVDPDNYNVGRVDERTETKAIEIVNRLKRYGPNKEFVKHEAVIRAFKRAVNK